VTKTALADSVKRLRAQPVVGRTIDLVPYGPEHHANTARQRNIKRARYNLNQDFESTEVSQARWFEAYLSRYDDVMWAIVTKYADFIGTTSLYDITENQGEKGRLVIDPKKGLRGPYALEAELLVLEIAFTDFGLERVITVVRDSNAKMNSMNVRLGFTRTGTRLLRGEPYGLYTLEPASFQPVGLNTVIDHWEKRASSRELL